MISFVVFYFHSPESFPVFIFICAVALLFAYIFSRKVLIKDELKKVKQKKIGDFKDGDKGRIVGKVVFAGQTLTAPISGRKCSWYHVRVTQYKYVGEARYAQVLLDESKQGDVVICDGDHYAIIDTREAKAFITSDVVYNSGFLQDASPELQSFLKKYKVAETNMIGLNKTMKYEEGVLEKDETFTVSGQGFWNESADHNLKIPAKQVLVITTSKENEKVYVSDDPDTVREPRA